MPASADLKYMTHMIFLTLAGTIRGHLEVSPSPRAVPQLREHLANLILAYCEMLSKANQSRSIRSLRAHWTERLRFVAAKA